MSIRPPRDTQIYATHYLKQGDFGDDVYIEATLYDRNGPVSLAGRTVRVIVSKKPGAEPVVNAPATPDEDQVTNPGVVRWYPKEGDVDFSGSYFLEWEVRTDGTDPVTFPRDGYDQLIVAPELGSAS